MAAAGSSRTPQSVRAPLLRPSHSSSTWDWASYSLAALIRVKPIQLAIRERTAQDVAQTGTTHPALKKTLNLVDVLGYGVGCTVGAGIYSLVGPGAAIAGMYSSSHKLTAMLPKGCTRNPRAIAAGYRTSPAVQLSTRSARMRLDRLAVLRVRC